MSCDTYVTMGAVLPSKAACELLLCNQELQLNLTCHKNTFIDFFRWINDYL